MNSKPVCRACGKDLAADGYVHSIIQKLILLDVDATTESPRLMEDTYCLVHYNQINAAIRRVQYGEATEVPLPPRVAAPKTLTQPTTLTITVTLGD